MCNDKNKFHQGYMCALATIVRSHGLDTEIRDALGCNFLTIAQMKNAEVDEYDIEVLKPYVKEILRKQKIFNQ